MAWWIKAILLSVSWVVLSGFLMMLISAALSTDNPNIDHRVTGERIYQIHPCVSTLGIIPIWILAHRRWAKTTSDERSARPPRTF